MTRTSPVRIFAALTAACLLATALAPQPASANNREVSNSGPGSCALIPELHGGWHAAERLLGR